MQFTTCSTLANAFIISTVALLQLIQAVNALDLSVPAPIGPNGQSNLFFPGEVIKIQWYVPNRAGSHSQDRSLMAGISGSHPTIVNYL